MKVLTVTFLSQNILLYKFNVFSILTKNLPNTLVVTAAVWSVTTKLAYISFPFFTISQIVNLSNLSILVFFFPPRYLLTQEFYLFI